MNEFQQTFLYSMLSNTAPSLVNQPFSGSNINVQAAAMIQKQMAQNLPGALAGLGLGASVAWGPCVFVDPNDVKSGSSPNTYNVTATNTVVIFQSGNTYIVAIAGTKASSMYDILNEDTKVGVLVPWSYGNPGGKSPKISTGTNDGLNAIFTIMRDPSSNQTIQQFFSGISASGNTVTFTGHSLGGALAPAVALALFGSNSNLLSNRSGWTAQVYATAGPDIGNSDYVSYFQGCFPAQKNFSGPVWQQYNVKIFNSLDIVPEVWSAGFADRINSIYTPYKMSTPLKVSALLATMGTSILAHNGGNPYQPLTSTTPYSNNSLVAGEFKGSFITPSSITPPSMVNYDCNTCSAGQALCDFCAEILYQHLDAYLNEFQLSSVLPAFSKNPISVCALASKFSISAEAPAAVEAEGEVVA